jgi:hypothetical protein
MPRYTVKITADYEGEVTASSKAEAEELFLDDLSTHQLSLYNLKIRKLGKDGW